MLRNPIDPINALPRWPKAVKTGPSGPGRAQLETQERPQQTIRQIYVSALAIVVACVFAQSTRADWPTTPPESLPPVTVRWEDPGQTEIFVIEGAHYRCRVATRPAHILSLEIDGVNLLGPDGAQIGVTSADGRRYMPPVASFVPHWNVWRHKWAPATTSRARMNIWSDGLYYEDAHLLDIPLVSEATQSAIAAAGALVHEWSFDADAQGWTARNDCGISWRNGALAIETNGPGPNIQSPPLNLVGPFDAVVRMRTEEAGVGQVYWLAEDDSTYSEKHSSTFPVIADGAWHDYRVRLANVRNLKALRFDPPGEMGVTELKAIQLLSLPGAAAYQDLPIRGHLVFHAFPDQLRIEFRSDSPVDPADTAPRPINGFLKIDVAGTSMPAILQGRSLTILKSGTASAAVLGSVGASFDTNGLIWTAPMSAAAPSACWVVRPVLPGDPLPRLFSNDLHPLDPGAAIVTGGKWLGYDSNSGLYNVEAKANLGAFGFEQAYQNPNREDAVALTLRNTERLPRNIVVKCATGIGNLEAAVLTDAFGFPKPVPVQVSKNFSGEMEEADDTAYGDSYFPIALAPGERLSFTVASLTQNWGNHPLKQVSSIRFNNIYWHLSTGASESTCMSQNWMEIGRSGTLTIPDFRPRSGAMYVDQPQHDCEQWPGFLQYNDGAARLVYDRTTFRSVSPNLARFTMDYHTSDNAATAKITVLEIPQRDEMRTFVHLRYDWQQSATITGDARQNFRWLNLFEKHKPDALLWTDANGTTKSIAVAASDKPLLLGEPLSVQSPFVASQAALTPITANASAEIGKNYNCLVLVRGFHARLGGREYRQPAFSAKFGAQDGSYWLTAPIDSLVLQPGDFIDADIMLMPFAGPTQSDFVAERERLQRFGTRMPNVTDVSYGTKIIDFPATIDATDEVVGCTMNGGFDEMPLIVEGFKKPGVPLLWRDGVYQNQQVNGGDGYEVEPDSAGGYRFTLLYPIREGQHIPLMVTRVECTSGITHIRDVNGRVAINAPRIGTFTLKAPVLFEPGQNRATAGTPVYSFTGASASIRQAPVRIALPVGQTTVAIDDSGTNVTTTGAPSTVTFSNLSPGASYTVSINDVISDQKAASDGTISVSAPAPTCHIRCIAREVEPEHRASATNR